MDIIIDEDKLNDPHRKMFILFCYELISKTGVGEAVNGKIQFTSGELETLFGTIFDQFENEINNFVSLTTKKLEKMMKRNK